MGSIINTTSSLSDLANDDAFNRDEDSVLLTNNPDGTKNSESGSVTYYDTMTLLQLDYQYRQTERFKTLGAMQMMDGISGIKSALGVDAAIETAKAGVGAGLGIGVGTGYQGDMSGVNVPAGTIVMPVKGYTKEVPKADSGIGFDITKYSRGDGTRKHKGVDLMMPIGTPVLAPWDGVVTSVILTESANLGGLAVCIKSSDGMYTSYGCHLKEGSIVVQKGQSVLAGQVIAQVGITGNARPGGPSNAHLHFGIKNSSGVYINPEPILSKAVRG